MSAAASRGKGQALSYIIQLASVDDAAQLARTGAELFCQAYEGAIRAEDLAAYATEAFSESIQRNELRDPDVATLLVRHGAGVAGFAQLRRRDLPIDDCRPANVELWRIYVDRRHHGTGLARQLLGEAGAVARSLGATGIWLAVWEQNRRAMAFYEKHGFRRAGRQAFKLLEELQCDVVMVAPPDAF